MRWPRMIAVSASAAVLAVTITPELAIPRGETPDGCLLPARAMTMYVEELPRVGGKPRLGYGLTPDSASYPGPTIEMVEGECLAITIVNDVSVETLREIRNDPIIGDPTSTKPLGVSLHVHGVKYLPSSDGTFETDSWVPPGGSRTYVWYAQPRITLPSGVLGSGTAGYWWYHDHVVGTSHGTGGAASGLFGALIVRRPEDVRPDRTFVVGFGPDATINLRKHPDCDPDDPVPSNTCFVATEGDLVEFAVIGFGNDFHTFHLHGHNWAANRTGLLRTTIDPVDVIDNRTVGPADTFGFIVTAGSSVGPGDWMMHCHVQVHSDAGMTTFFHVLPKDGGPAVPMSIPLHDH